MAQRNIREIGDRIRKERQRQGITRDELARVVGCHWGSLGGWERGSSFPSFGNLERLAAALKVSATYLESGRDPQDESRPQTTNPGDMAEQHNTTEIVRSETLLEVIEDCRRRASAIVNVPSGRMRILIEFV
jgi:transcriptional regulator with XRE-family HTH domain